MSVDVSVTGAISSSVVPPGLSILINTPRHTKIIGSSLNEAHVLAVGSGLKISAESDGTLVSLELGASGLNYELRFGCVLIPDISLILLISSHDSVSIGISTSVETSGVHPGSSARSIKGVVLDGNIESNSSSSSSLSS